MTRLHLLPGFPEPGFHLRHAISQQAALLAEFLDVGL